MPTYESFRPQFHYSPRANWLNDPNGLVYYAGEYHLFYQYHPDSSIWGPMHWGHAVSSDLVHWTDLPIALAPDELGVIFSGSAVIDWHDTAGFGTEAMVALFTHHVEADHRQSQSIAYSLDQGRTWHKYSGNPVISTPPNQHHFRDPKVIWYGSATDGHWVMSLAAGHAILFYTSPNLIDWTPSGRFDGHGAVDGLWETPDLFELPVCEANESRWVLLVGVGDGAPAGGSGEQYFVGHFDGKTFHNENTATTVLWADYGADAYAGQTWSDTPDGRRIKISWMSNWTYARAIPTHAWRGTMTLPRELSLVQTPVGIRLRQQPITALQALRRPSTRYVEERRRIDGRYIPELEPGALWEIRVEFDLKSVQTGQIGLWLRWADGSTVAIGYIIDQQRLFLDRSTSGVVDFDPSFPAVHWADYGPDDGVLRLHLFVDRASLELFINDGILTMTEQIFPRDSNMRLELFAAGCSVLMTLLEIDALEPALPLRNRISSVSATASTPNATSQPKKP